MIYIFSLFMIATGYYSFTYGLNLWHKNNKLGGFGVAAISVIGVILPMVIMFLKR